MRGVTLIEIVITSALSLIIAMAVGTLVVAGNRAWHSTYDSTFGQLQTDGVALTTAFGSVGRRANRLSYSLYKIANGKLVVAEPTTPNSEEAVFGDAVEFRYWDVELDAQDSKGVMDSSKVATAYALFYLDGGKVKVDYGPYPPGAIPAGAKSGTRNTSGVSTKVLAENVSHDPDSTEGIFSHTTINGVGQGSIRINLVLTDPDTEETMRVTTATMLRNVWPR